jgi:chromosome segregation ATPase
MEEDYREKLNLQQQNFESEIEEINSKFDLSRNDRRNEMDEIRMELEDNQTLIQLLSREKYDLTANLEGKTQEIVKLNEEIIGLKESLESYKDMLSDQSTVSSHQRPSMPPVEGSQSIASQDEILYDNYDTSSEYYSVVRKAILSKFQNFDFSPYAGKEGVVNLLKQCFQEAAPFPPFPKNLNKKSQRFALSVSFKSE